MHEILYSILTADNSVKTEVGQATNLTNHASSCMASFNTR